VARTDSSTRGQCRIIAGKWRGRIVQFDDAEGLRPTTDRIRETVFNWLQPYLPNSVCLDCFAGSGVLGFEALSRGASELVFVEKNKLTASKLKENIRQLQAKEVSVFQADAVTWLQSEKTANSSHCFDLVFLDPPFHSNLLESSCASLVSSGSLAADAIIYVEHGADENVAMPENWFCLKEKKSGQVIYKLYENQTV